MKNKIVTVRKHVVNSKLLTKLRLLAILCNLENFILMAQDIITIPKPSQEAIDYVTTEVNKRLTQRVQNSKRGIYTSDAESYGKIAEEFNKEALDELHANNHQKFADELLDVIASAFWGAVSSYDLYDTRVLGLKPPK